MVASYGAKSRSELDGFLNWLKMYWPVILGIFVIVPILYRYLVAQVQKNKEQSEDIKAENQVIDNENPQVRAANANKITIDKNLHSSAEQLAHHLGTKDMSNSWTDIFNLSTWSENDAEVLKILKYQVRNMYIIEKLYFEVYTKRRNLKDDVNKLLDDAEMKELQSYYRKYGKVW